MAIITLTAEHIEQLKTPAGGYNEASMKVLGCWPLSAGWKERLIGSTVGDRRFRSAVNEARRGKKHFFRGNTRSHRH